MYKGHMDKAKVGKIEGGWGGGKQWWENGDNCTWTTIKKEIYREELISYKSFGKMQIHKHQIPLKVLF